MGKSRCYSFMKCLLIMFNIIFLAVGAGACGFAAWALWDGSGLGEEPAGRAGRAGLGALCAWGGALALGAAAALAGAARRSAALLAAAAALLALAAAAEGAAAWWGAAHLPQLRAALRDRFDLMLREDYGRVPSRTQVIDIIQRELECCGAESVRDWQRSAWARAQERQLAGGEAGGAAGGAGGAAPWAPAAAARAADALDLSVSAPAAYYWVPASCCAHAPDEAGAGGAEGAGAGAGAGEGGGCASARRVSWASRGALGLHAAPCGPRVLAALARGARGPLLAGAALLAAQLAALLLAAALSVHERPPRRYKA